MRIGIHSGPVTAGVLRGENARYQLFGDTMNTAARMESTGVPGRIQMSKQTAEILEEQGKCHWILARKDPVPVKGKGTLQTFWLNMEHHGSRGQTGSSEHSTTSGHCLDEEIPGLATAHERAPIQHLVLEDSHASRKGDDNKLKRLIDWNASVLQEWLLCVVFQRSETQSLPNEVSGQLHQYVSTIASLYRSNAFHDFEHASHVTMSVTKLLARVTANCKGSKNAHFINDISSDALTHFAAVFSALIHDVDHTGFSNATLVAERVPAAIKYNNKSVAENNSIEIAWELLMRDDFSHLRRCICPNEAEQRRFHHLVVSSVLATDIVDRSLKAERNERWEAAFRDGSNSADIVQLRSAIVLEHLLQGR
jgi:Adenylate and Guanylate cyclase catalytic domain/3'5'-cyclic nucleotide phosphodiesterase